MPGYESGLVKSITSYVKPGDNVTIIGGGLGVTAVIAALTAQPNGHVNCYEGGIDSVASIKNTVSLNNSSNFISVHHAVVGDNIKVYGSSDNAKHLDISELPECDVLELDCEGSELGILTNMSARPRCVIVETHGSLGSETSVIRNILVSKGYQVFEAGTAEPRVEAYCVKHDIMVLVGLLKPS